MDQEPGEVSRKPPEKKYSVADVVVFLRTKDQFGGLSNMASGYPLLVEGVEVKTSEALYQACRFPGLPEVQQKILDQASPMSAKMVSKPERGNTRSDWLQVRTGIMRWCIRVKLLQNWESFSQLLLSTGDKPIVEESRRDSFWGARRVFDDELVGANVLGGLLTDLRNDLLRGRISQNSTIEPPKIPNFMLLDQSIGPVGSRKPIGQQRL